MAWHRRARGPRQRTGAPGEGRHPRSITATDGEWQRVTVRANQAGMPISRHAVTCLSDFLMLEKAEEVCGVAGPNTDSR